MEEFTLIVWLSHCGFILRIGHYLMLLRMQFPNGYKCEMYFILLAIFGIDDKFYGTYF